MYEEERNEEETAEEGISALEREDSELVQVLNEFIRLVRQQNTTYAEILENIGRIGKDNVDLYLDLEKVSENVNNQRDRDHNEIVEFSAKINRFSDSIEDLRARLQTLSDEQKNILRLEDLQTQEKLLQEIRAAIDSSEIVKHLGVVDTNLRGFSEKIGKNVRLELESVEERFDRVAEEKWQVIFDSIEAFKKNSQDSISSFNERMVTLENALNRFENVVFPEKLDVVQKTLSQEQRRYDEDHIARMDQALSRSIEEMEKNSLTERNAIKELFERTSEEKWRTILNSIETFKKTSEDSITSFSERMVTFENAISRFENMVIPEGIKVLKKGLDESLSQLTEKQSTERARLEQAIDKSLDNFITSAEERNRNDIETLEKARENWQSISLSALRESQALASLTQKTLETLPGAIKGQQSDAIESLVEKIASIENTLTEIVDQEKKLAEKSAFSEGRIVALEQHTKEKMDRTYYFQLMVFASQWVVLIVFILFYFWKG